MAQPLHEVHLLPLPEVLPPPPLVSAFTKDVQMLHIMVEPVSVTQRLTDNRQGELQFDV
jgi:hypothetical protein